MSLLQTHVHEEPYRKLEEIQRKLVITYISLSRIRFWSISCFLLSEQLAEMILNFTTLLLTSNSNFDFFYLFQENAAYQ